MRRLAVLAVALVISCAPLTRTNRMIAPYVGRSIDDFMREQVVAADVRTPLSDGGAVYAFHGGPGGVLCEYYISTDKRGIITRYRFEHC